MDDARKLYLVKARIIRLANLVKYLLQENVGIYPHNISVCDGRFGGVLGSISLCGPRAEVVKALKLCGSHSYLRFAFLGNNGKRWYDSRVYPSRGLYARLKVRCAKLSKA